MSSPDPSHQPQGSADSGLPGRQRLRVIIRALRSREPVVAPAALEGLVVAAMHVGYRQERAAGTLRTLPAVVAPAGLDAAVAARILQNDPRPRSLGEAPAELEDLVARRVAAPEETLVEGFAQRLESVDAPGVLDGRVDALLRELRHPSVRGADAPSGRRIWVGATASLAVAACALFAVAATGFFGGLGGGVGGGLGNGQGRHVSGEILPEEGTGRTSSGVLFEVVRVTPKSLAPTDRAVLSVLGLPLDGGNS